MLGHSAISEAPLSALPDGGLENAITLAVSAGFNTSANISAINSITLHVGTQFLLDPAATETYGVIAGASFEGSTTKEASITLGVTVGLKFHVNYDALITLATTTGVDFNPVALAVDDTIGVSTSFSVAEFVDPNKTIGVTAHALFSSTIIKLLSVSNTVHLTQTAQEKRYHSEHVTQTIHLTQHLYRILTPHNTLTISNTASVRKIKHLSPSSRVNLTQAASKRSVIARSASNTLVFLPTRVLPGNVKQYQAAYALVGRKCLVILRVAQKTIVLPCPIFGDSEAMSGNVVVQKSINGTIYTYVKSSNLEQLRYAFQLGRQKSLELRKFLRNYGTEQILMRNHKGETWVVKLVINPFELKSAARFEPEYERVDISLDFEGTRIA